MKPVLFILICIVITNGISAQCLTKYGQITTTNTDVVDKNGKIGGSTALNKYGQVLTLATLDATTAASSIAICTAISGGNVTSDGGATITARGVCWSTSPSPVATDSHTTDAGTTGTFTSTITGLAGTTYYVRSYATNCVGTAYGSEINFTTLVSTASSNSPICEGTTLSLTSSAGTSYSWSGPNSFTGAEQNPTIANATTAATGTYIVTVTGAGGCTSTTQTTVTVNALPAAPTSVTPSSGVSICSGSSTNLNATSAGNTIYWYTVSTGGSSIGTSASGVNFSVSPTSNTTYYAEARTGAGCISATRTATALVTVTGWCSCTVRFSTDGTSPCLTGETTVALSNNGTSQCDNVYFGTNCNSTVNITVGGVTKTVRVLLLGIHLLNDTYMQIGTDALGTGIYRSQNTTTHRPQISTNWGYYAGWLIHIDGQDDPSGGTVGQYATCGWNDGGEYYTTPDYYYQNLNALCCE